MSPELPPISPELRKILDIGVSRYEKADGRQVLEVDTKKAVYKGKSWTDLTYYERKKYDNLLFIAHSRNHPLIVYR